MSEHPACPGGVLALGDDGAIAEQEKQPKVSFSLITIGDNASPEDLSSTPEPTPAQAWATSTPAKNLDLLKGMSTSQLPDTSPSYSAKRKRSNLPPTTIGSTRLNDSGESIKQVAKRVNNVTTSSDPSLLQGEQSTTGSGPLTIIANPTNSTGSPEGTGSRDNPSNNAGSANDFIIYAESDLSWHSNGAMTLYTATSLAPFVVFVESMVSGLNLGKLDPIKVIDLLTPFILGGK